MNIGTDKPLNRLRDICHGDAKNNGWWDEERDFAEIIANFHGEVSELWEAYRDAKLSDPCDKAEQMAAAGLQPLTCQEEELADIIIRVMDYAGYAGVDIDMAVQNKIGFNLMRGHRHGGKKA